MYDYLKQPLEVGDKVAVITRYKEFTIGTIVKIAPKVLIIQYAHSSVTLRRYSKDVIKITLEQFMLVKGNHL